MDTGRCIPACQNHLKSLRYPLPKAIAMPFADAIDYLGAQDSPKKIPNQIEARLWCNAPILRNRFPAANQ